MIHPLSPVICLSIIYFVFIFGEDHNSIEIDPLLWAVAAIIGSLFIFSEFWRQILCMLHIHSFEHNQYLIAGAHC